MPGFMTMLRSRWNEGRFVCIGLDSAHDALPASLRAGKTPDEAVLAFNKAIVDATADLACAYKPNIAFYARKGADLRGALARSCAHIRQAAPGVPIILDAKRGDIGSTNAGYIAEAFEEIDADAITVSPYLGKEALEPFLRIEAKGVFVLCRTSNAGAAEFQERDVWLDEVLQEELLVRQTRLPLYQYVALRVARTWNANGNCALVVGATAPDALKAVRDLVGNMPILVPGVGAQAGDLQAVLAAGLTASGDSLIVNASRSVIFASPADDFAAAARRETERLHDAISRYRQGASIRGIDGPAAQG